MSGFVNTGVFTSISIKDRRLIINYQGIRRERDRIVERKHATEVPSGYLNAFWPGNRGLIGAYEFDVAIHRSIWARPISRIGHGAGSRVGFVGVTRDGAGGRLGGVTCSLFRTSDKLWIMDVISGADGGFLLQSWYSPDTHFIVFSKSGAPDVVGTTRQTLVGA